MSVPIGLRRYRRRWTAASAVLCMAVLATSCAHGPPDIVLAPIAISVHHGDDVKTVKVVPGTTVGVVMARAGLTGTDGQVLSAATKEPVGPNGNQPVLTADGRAVQANSVLIEPVSIDVVDGEDSVEEVEVQQRVLAPGGLPDALQFVHTPGEPGVEEVTVGSVSGEVVARRTITAAVPAHRATGKVLSLTFDDGPDPTWTPLVLEILRAKGVTATFCQVGTMVDAHPELSQRIVDEGHQLCNHTEHHVEGLETEPTETIAAEFDGGLASIEAAVGAAPPFYRPPGGSLGPGIYDAAAARDEQVLYWSIDPQDWRRPAPLALAISVVSTFEPGGIILLHDGGGDRSATVAALPLIIEFAKAMGYTFTAPLSRRSQVG